MELGGEKQQIKRIWTVPCRNSRKASIDLLLKIYIFKFYLSYYYESVIENNILILV